MSENSASADFKNDVISPPILHQEQHLLQWESFLKVKDLLVLKAYREHIFENKKEAKRLCIGITSFWYNTSYIIHQTFQLEDELMLIIFKYSNDIQER